MNLLYRLLVLAMLGAGLMAQKASAQTQSPPSLPEKPLSQAPPLPRTSKPGYSTTHAFWDRKNALLFSGVAVFRALDYASTKNMLARGREEILIPDDVVNSQAGFPALEAAGTATSIGLSYLMHRTHHHKLERWISIVHIGVTGFGAARNYALESRHPAAQTISRRVR